MSTKTIASMLPAPTLNVTDPNISALNTVNKTTSDWGVEPLPSDLRVINGTIVEGILPNTTIISRIKNNSIGAVPIIPFIYLIMSLVIILAMIPESLEWVRSVSGKPSKWEPGIGASGLTPRKFEKQLKRPYSVVDQALQSLSQAETVYRNAGTESRDIRECQELIRAKFGLDIEVYNLRDARRVDRHIVEDKKRRSEGALKDVKKITQGWRAARNQWSEEEYKLVVQIQETVQRLEAQ